MKAKFVFTIVFVIIANFSNAQNIKLLSATQQNWAGGVAGWHGSNYYIELQTSDYKIVPDTVWIGAIPFALDSADKEATFNKSIDSVHHIVTYTISAGEGFHSNVSADHFSLNPLHPKYKVAIKQYTGAALITYMYKHKQCSFVIKEFKVLPAQNYP